MSLFKFFKSKKIDKTENKFIGRHQQAFAIKRILGENVTSMEMQIAINKDLGERSEIVAKLEKLEAEIHSESFINQFDVESARKEIDEILNNGYKSCVLQNDIDLENRSLKILRDAIEYFKNFLKKRGTGLANINDLLNLRVTSGFLYWVDLGGLLQTSEEQQAWIIVSSLINTERPVGGFSKSDLVSSLLSVLSKEDVGGMAENYTKMKERLLQNKTINQAEAKRIDELIEKGLADNRRLKERYPTRPSIVLDNLESKK